MKFKFESLIIWQKAMSLGEEINAISNSFPKKEIYNLSSQICRAVDSIEQSAPEFKRFMGYAIRSLAEVVTCLHKAKNRNYISEEIFNEQYDLCFNLMNMMVAFKNKINQH